MRKPILIILAALLSSYCYSQISFEKGYYINNNEQKIACFIKNIDWKNSPTEFQYKLSENSVLKKATIEFVKEFGIYNYSKYIRGTLKIDRSSSDLDDLSANRNPIFNEEKLFLKVLVEGKSSLYQYEDGNLVRFFFDKDNSNNIQQLIFKNYKTTGDLIGENNGFKQQLLNDLKCEHIKFKDYEKINYRKQDLVKLFVRYNQCSNSDLVNFEEKQKKDLFNLTIRPRLNSSSLVIQGSVFNYGLIDFGNEIGFGLGIELESILPFNKNKWGIILEPTYHSFKSEKKLSTSNVNVDYKSIELAIGIRHYFFLKNNAKLFINGSFIRDFPSNSTIDFDPGVDLEISSETNLAFGIGYKQNDKFSLELRYLTTRALLNYVFWGSDYKTVSVIFGYTIF